MNDLLHAIAELLRAVAWPSVAIFGAIYFRGEIADLAKRLRKGGGAEFDPIPQSTAPPSDVLSVASTTASLTVSKHASDVLESVPRTPAIGALEQGLRDFPAIKSVGSLEEREKILIRLLARAILTNQFEQAESNIWASQLELLAYLNSKRQGEGLPQLKGLFYDKATAQYPNWYQNYAFDAWMEFLRRNALILVNGGTAMITDTGIEYLAWRVQQAKPPKLAG